MNELCRLIWCGLIGFFRSRASLEAEILVLRHQLNILRRKSPKRPTFGSIDRLIFAGLYGLAPNASVSLRQLATYPFRAGMRGRRKIGFRGAHGSSEHPRAGWQG